VKAGDKSKEAFANEEAIAYYNQALKLMDDVGAVRTCPPLLGHIYQSMGEIYFPLSKHQEALEYCHKALEYTTDKRQRARIYGIMGWIYEREHKYDLALEHLNAGIAELGDDAECPEMASICIPLFWVTWWEDGEEAIKIAQRGLNIVEGTEHYFEIVELYTCLIWVYAIHGRDIDKAFEYAEKSVEIAQKSGNSYLIAHSTRWLGWVHLQTQWQHLRSDGYDAAIKFTREAAGIYEKIGHNFDAGQAYLNLWFIYQKRGDLDEAIEYGERVLEIPGHPYHLCFDFHLASQYLQKGDAEKAIESCKRALEVSDLSAIVKGQPSIFGIPNISIFVAQSLGIMEEALARIGRKEELTPYCIRLREEKGEDLRGLRLTQWYLEPKELPELFTETAFVDEFDEPALKSEWEWVNPRGDSSYSLSSEASWLELRAASGSDMHGSNFDAPRLLQEISGDFAAEVKMKRVSDDLPSVSGLLVWKDEENYIRFERGMNLKDEISLAGNVQGEYDHFGRGMLASDIVYLRLERIGDRFSAYCSSDGENWMTCGEVSFPAEDPIQIGIHAIGGIGRVGMISLGDMVTATRFDYFRVMK
jgi:tetratricopeptide (TPR) repeat protein